MSEENIKKFYETIAQIISGREQVKVSVQVRKKGGSSMSGETLEGLSREMILGSVVCQLVNREKNQKLLMDVPHMDVLDLAVVYRVAVGGDENIADSFIVNHGFCGKYKISLEELDGAARINTEAGGFDVLTMAEIMEETADVQTEPAVEVPAMFILTSHSRANGAAVMLYGKYFDRLAQKLGSDLYVLPSSIHEVIAVPACCWDPAVLGRMVMQVNAEEVPAEEVLSENVYKYNRRKGVLEIA